MSFHSPWCVSRAPICHCIPHQYSAQKPVCLPSNDNPSGAMLQEMEDMFRRTIPQEARYGSRFVFRQVHSSMLVSRVLTAAADNLLVVQ